jgi:hypothetical protein
LDMLWKTMPEKLFYPTLNPKQGISRNSHVLTRIR